MAAKWQRLYGWQWLPKEIRCRWLSKAPSVYGALLKGGAPFFVLAVIGIGCAWGDYRREIAGAMEGE